MTKFKIMITTGAMVLAIGAVGMTTFAATQYSTPAEIVANLTGRTLQSVVDEKNETGKTYGTMANEKGKLEGFKSFNLQVKKDSLAEQVSAGTITQEEADAIVTAIEVNQATCDGINPAQIGKQMGVDFGGNGIGKNQGSGKGQGKGIHNGMRGRGNGGIRLQNGSCN